MGGNNLIKKGLVVAVIILFIGLAFAPSINANISKTSIDSELVEITVEVSGIDGVKPHTVSLTKEDADEVEKDDIERRLDNVETREETVEIFNEAVVELDKYGLLGGLSVKQVQRLVSKINLNLRFGKLVEEYFGSEKEENDTSNRLCLVATKVQGSSICGSLRVFFFLERMAHMIAFLLHLTQEQEFDILDILDFAYFFIFPFRLFSTAIVFNQYPIDWGAEVLEYFSIGLRGIKRGGEWSIMIGFSGLFITMYYKELRWYFGSTLLVGY